MAKIININIPVTEDEHQILVEYKGDKTWREFILENLPIKPQNEVKDNDI